MTIRNLQFAFRPRSIAVIGQGTQAGSADAVLVRNLVGGGFQGPVMPVNPDRLALEGVLCYPDVASLPLVPELAVMTTPLDHSPTLIAQLGARGTRAVVLISRERLGSRGDGGAALGQAMLEAARPHTLRIIGPDCLGVAVPARAINATLSPVPLGAGHLGLLSQSCAIMRAVMDRAHSHGIGFSHLVSMGSRIDVDFGDMLDYLARDAHTRAILLYLEEVRHARKFMSAARAAARIKPVIVLRPRFSETDAREDAVYEAAFQRAGMMRVDSIEELFSAVDTLATVRPVQDDRLGIVGNSRSLGLMAADRLAALGGTLATFGEGTHTRLAGIAPAGTPVGNPMDLGDEAGQAEYATALSALLRDPGLDAVLVLHAPTASERDLQAAKAVVEEAERSRRLVLSSWVGAAAAAPARRLFQDNRLATYASPGEAVQAFARVAQYRRTQQLLMETPPSLPETFAVDRDAAHAPIAANLAAGRRRLGSADSARVLQAYGIPVVETRLAQTVDEAVALAAELGPEVVLKIQGPEIRQKSEVGGLALGVRGADAVRATASAMLERVARLAPERCVDGIAVQPMRARAGAYEVLIEVRTGTRFGPVLTFGHGGTEAEVIEDLSHALPPLNLKLARDMMGHTRLYRRMSTSRGRPADLDALAFTLLKVSQMTVDLGELVEVVINPLWVDGAGVVAVDARMEIAPFSGEDGARLAIRPYPKELERELELPDGRRLLMRPVVPEDEPALQAMVRRLPAEDVRMRFFQPLRELSHAMAARLTQLDYDREMAFAVTEPAAPGRGTIWGVVRMNADPDLERAEYAILLDHTMTGIGLGPMMMRRIIDYARSRGIGEIYGEVLRENEAMLKLNRALGFTARRDPEDPGIVHVSLLLGRQNEDGV